MWFYRRFPGATWTEKRTDHKILEELNKGVELLGLVGKRKVDYFGHAMRHRGCHVVRLVAQGKINGKKGVKEDPRHPT